MHEETEEKDRWWVRKQFPLMRFALCCSGFFMTFFPYRSCSPKRQKLMGENGADEYPSPKVSQRWSVESIATSPSEASPVQLQTEPRTEEMGLPFTSTPSPLPRVPTEGSSMEVDTTQRRLQEIEDRWDRMEDIIRLISNWLYLCLCLESLFRHEMYESSIWCYATFKNRTFS